ncbi:MAG: succinate dehydrogenase assembly factor 2 [Betaproteobacteria bacterium]|nr:succinate dehydrogenase assembly factor 2 [Betaproteobacteria bacterium]
MKAVLEESPEEAAENRVSGMDHAAFNRLRWRCTRRAFLELDLALGHFLDTGFQDLDEEEREAFVALAELEDHELWALVSGKEKCANALWAKVLARIRSNQDYPHTRKTS